MDKVISIFNWIKKTFGVGVATVFLIVAVVLFFGWQGWQNANNISQIGSRLDCIEKMQVELREHGDKIKSLESESQRLSSRLSYQSGKMEGMEATINSLRVDMSSLKTDVSSVRVMLQDLKADLREINYSGRRK